MITPRSRRPLTRCVVPASSSTPTSRTAVAREARRIGGKRPHRVHARLPPGAPAHPDDLDVTRPLAAESELTTAVGEPPRLSDDHFTTSVALPQGPFR